MAQIMKFYNYPKKGIDQHRYFHDAFICNSYQGTDFFYMNWGWGEISDSINEYQYPTDNGWHLISLPVLPDNGTLTQLFPDARVAFEYCNNQYVKADQLEYGIGYWALLK